MDGGGGRGWGRGIRGIGRRSKPKGKEAVKEWNGRGGGVEVMRRSEGGLKGSIQRPPQWADYRPTTP